MRKLIAALALALFAPAAFAADILGIEQRATTRSPNDSFLVRWVDQSDGTWALKGASGAGGAGGASTIADGADVTQGAIADTAVAGGAAGTLNAHLRTLTRDLIANVGIAILPAFPAGTNSIGTVGLNAGVNAIGSVTVTGTTAVSASALPLPAGAATAAKQPAIGTAGSASVDVLTVQGRASMTPLLVDPSGVTSPVSAASLPLPAGASTSANQTTINTSIGTLHTDLTAGQLATAVSQSVTRPSDPDARPASGTITVQDTGSSAATGAGGVNTVITGSPTAGSTQSIALNGRSVVRMQISGTWTGTLQSEVSIDGGTTYNPTPMNVVAGTQKTSTTFTLIGGAFAAVPGATHFRMRATAAVTGTATINFTASDAPGAVVATTPVGLAAGASLIGSAGIDQTTPGTTNAVDLKTVNGGTTLAVNTGATNTGTLRVSVAAVGQGNAIAERPIVVGASGWTANPTAVTNNQATVLMADKLGRLVVVSDHIRDLTANADLTLTSTTTPTTLIAAGGANVFTDITGLTIGNSSVTATLVTLSDGTASHIFSLPAISTMVIPMKFKATTANVAWTLACGTSVASVYAVVTYVKNL